MRASLRRPRNSATCRLGALVVLSLTMSSFAQVPVRINSGWDTYTDQAGQVWRRDAYFQGGRLSFSLKPIENTTDDFLYQNNRLGAHRYLIPIAPGMVDVTLHFCEYTALAANQRRFDVYIEGQRVAQNVDVFRESGGRFRALIRTARVYVGDGTMNLRFVGVTGEPLISAIQAAPIPSLDASPVQHNFGAVSVGAVSASLTVTMINIGSLPVRVSALRFEGGQPQDFRTIGFAPVTLAPGTTAPAYIAFAPLAPGVREASLVMELDNAQHYVPLSGTGVAAGLARADVMGLRGQITDGAAGGFGVSWSSELGRTYQVSRATTPAGPWVPVRTMEGDGHTLTYPVTVDEPSVFIRVTTP